MGNRQGVQPSQEKYVVSRSSQTSVSLLGEQQGQRADPSATGTELLSNARARARANRVCDTVAPSAYYVCVSNLSFLL